MRRLREVREIAFKTLGANRFSRVITIAFLIANVWIFADWLSGSLSVNLWHDLLCLCIAIAVERLIPWGKSFTTESKEVS